MKLYTGNLLITIFYILAIFIQISFCEDEEEAPPRSCQKYIYDFVVDILNNALNCLAGRGTLHINHLSEYITRSGCLLKCIFQEDGTINKEGYQDDIAAAFYFEETFAPEVQQLSFPYIQACFPLADNFVPSDYWCKSYIPYIECLFNAILKGLIPYGGDCITNPVLGILFSVLKYLTPDSPKIAEDMEELRKAVNNNSSIKCLDKSCSKMYEYKKANGSNYIILYNKDMEIISKDSRKTKPKPINASNQTFKRSKTSK